MTDESIEVTECGKDVIKTGKTPGLFMFWVGVVLTAVFMVAAITNALFHFLSPLYNVLYCSVGFLFALQLLFLTPGSVKKKFRIMSRLAFLVFVGASLFLWGTVAYAVSTNFSVWDIFKQDVNVVATYQLPDGAEIMVLDEVSDTISYGRYLFYEKDGREHIFLIDYAAGKFWPEQCSFKMHKDILYVYERGRMECRFNTKTLELQRPHVPRGIVYTVAPVIPSFFHRGMADSQV